MQKAFIFDFDGTISETIPLTLDAFLAAYDALNLKRPTIEQIKSVFGAEEKGIFKTISPDYFDELYPNYLLQYEKLLEIRNQKPFNGIVEFLQQLRQRGARVSLVTGKGADTAAISVRKMGLGQYFDFVEGGGMEGSVKPEKIRKILAAYKISPADTFYLGDSPRDVTDSREVGVYPMAVTWSSIVTPSHFSHLGNVDIFESVDKARDFALSKIDS